MKEIITTVAVVMAMLVLLLLGFKAVDRLHDYKTYTEKGYSITPETGKCYYNSRFINNDEGNPFKVQNEHPDVECVIDVKDGYYKLVYVTWDERDRAYRSGEQTYSYTADIFKYGYMKPVEDTFTYLTSDAPRRLLTKDGTELQVGKCYYVQWFADKNGDDPFTAKQKNETSFECITAIKNGWYQYKYGQYISSNDRYYLMAGPLSGNNAASLVSVEKDFEYIDISQK